MIEFRGIVMRWMEITPEIARVWLLRNTVNRRVEQDTVNMYARDMQIGAWLLCMVPLCFRPDGSLGNGQHRLLAIIKSGIPCFMLVAHNVSPEIIAAMDRGRKRSAADQAHFLGEELTGRQASIARILAFGSFELTGGPARSYDEIMRAKRRHEDAIDFALSAGEGKSHKKGFSAPMLAVIARAWYTQDRNRIAQFLNIIRTGICQREEDTAAIKLRDFINDVPRSSSGSRTRIAIYQRTESSLWNFLRGVPMTKLYGTEKEMFPIPKDGARAPIGSSALASDNVPETEAA